MTVTETTWYKKILGMNRAEGGANKTFCSVCRLRFLCLCFSVEVLTRASPFLWEYQALTFHTYSAFSAAAKVPVNMLLFFFSSSAFTGTEINSSSREKERRKEGGERKKCIAAILGAEKLDVSWDFLLNIEWFVSFVNHLLFFFVSKHPALDLSGQSWPNCATLAQTDIIFY